MNIADRKPGFLALLLTVGFIIASPSAGQMPPLLEPADTKLNEAAINRLIDETLSSVADSAAPQRLAKANIEAVALVENRLWHINTADVKTVSGLVAQLGHDDWIEREAATYALRSLMPDVAEQLKAHHKAATDPEIQIRLESILRVDEANGRGQHRLRLALLKLYERHAAELLTARIPEDSDTPMTESARRFVFLTPFPALAEPLAGLNESQRLCVLLVRRLSNAEGTRSHDENEMLQEYTARQVIAGLIGLGYKLQIQPMKLDGAYHWTSFAKKLEGKSAFDVVTVSVNHKRDEPEQSSWVHIKSDSRWDYLFQVERRGMYNVAVLAEHTSYTNAFMVNQPEGRQYVREHVRFDRIHSVPASVSLPVYKLTSSEWSNWSRRGYSWAEHLIPKYYAGRIKLQPNAYDPPTLVRKPAGE